MGKDQFIKSILNEKVNMTPTGFNADELTPEQFTAIHTLFFDKILEISASNISGIEGYGKFNEEGKLEYSSFKDYLIGNFTEANEGYWYNWRQMFDTTILDRQFFEQYYDDMLSLSSYCEGQRYLVNNFIFFQNMITDGKSTVGFPDWTHAGVSDFLVEFTTLDVNKPYLKIPELLYAYCKERQIEVPNFKERFLCLGYYNGLNTLRWHASIDDVESCTTIKQSMRELKDRLYAL